MSVGAERRTFISVLSGALVAWALAARAQQPEKKYTIGILGSGPVSPASLTNAFFDKLRELGWIEGKNISVEYRFAEDRPDRLAEFATDLVRLKVDVIVAIATLGPLAAKRATSTIPIVMTGAGDPLETGLAASLARPGGNVTGTSLMSADLIGKRLELLRQLLPRLARVAVLWYGANPYPALVFKETQTAGRAAAIEVQSLEVRHPDDLEGIFESARRQQPEALIVIEDPFIFAHLKRIADFALADKLPSLFGFREFAVAGGLLSYGANLADAYRLAAVYVDKILSGAKPADIPIQQPTKFDLVINLKTAKALGISVPQALLVAADEVIE